MVEYPEIFDMRDLRYCRCHNFYGKGHLQVTDSQNRNYRVKDYILEKILREQIRYLRVVHKYNLYYLEEEM